MLELFTYFYNQSYDCTQLLGDLGLGDKHDAFFRQLWSLPDLVDIDCVAKFIRG